MQDDWLTDDERLTAAPAANPDDNHVREFDYVRIVDGDTFLADIITIRYGRTQHRDRLPIRVHNYNAAELGTTEGAHMRDVFDGMLTAATIRRIHFTGRQTHDRIEADVFLDNQQFGLMLQRALTAFRVNHHAE